MPRNPDTPCAVCGRLLWPAKGTRAASLGQVCRSCRPQIPNHGTSSQVRRGCKCDECRAYKRLSNRQTTQNRRARGLPTRRGRSRGHKRWISPADREAIYERDGWRCLLCLKPIDPGEIGVMRASIDHIVPREVGGSDEPENLRAAHMLCNSRRGILLQ